MTTPYRITKETKDKKWCVFPGNFPHFSLCIWPLLQNFEIQSLPPLPAGKEQSGFLRWANKVPQINSVSLSKYRKPKCIEIYNPTRT